MKKYSEIEKLKNMYTSHNISLKQALSTSKDDFLYIEMTIGTKSWKLYVNDEYEDGVNGKPIIVLFLTLSSLEDYHDSLDYLDWGHQNLVNASDIKWLTYYRSLEKIYQEIKNELGEIDSCISPLDYQLRTGIINALIECEV